MTPVRSRRRLRRVDRSPIGGEAHHVEFGVATDGSGIAYSSVGAGAPLVHLPAGPFFTREMSIELLSRDASSTLPALRHVFYDHRAVGLSGGAARDFSLKAQTDDLHAVVEALDEPRVHIFAALNSAPAAIAYAVRRPQRVSSLTLWIPYLCGRDFHATHSIDARLALAETDWPMFLQTIAVQLFGWSGGARAARYTELVDRVMSRDALTDVVRAQQETDVTPLLSRLRTPTLVVHPRGVARPPTSKSARLVELVHDARLVLPAGDALLPFQSDLQTVGRAITRLTSDVAVQPASKLSMVPRNEPPDRGAAPLPAGLSERECEVLCLIAGGKTNKQIASDLIVTVGTVKRHTHNIYAKLNVARRIEAVTKARSLGLLSPLDQASAEDPVPRPQLV